MCVSPIKEWMERGPGYELIELPCGACWSCRANKLSDYVGRALCEAETCADVLAITLTYAPRKDAADKIITPIHFQKFIRSLRRRGQKVRYMGAGEAGKLKGRAHFHAILFFPEGVRKNKNGAVAAFNRPAPLCRRAVSDKTLHDGRVHIEEWPHGHVFLDWKVSEQALRYVCKYILKWEGTQKWFTISKNPAIGAPHFERKAQEMARIGVWPTGWTYMPPGGKPGREYMLTGACKRDYALALMKYHGKAPPWSQLSEWARHGFEWAIKQQHKREIERFQKSAQYAPAMEKEARRAQTIARQREAFRLERVEALERKARDERLAQRASAHYDRWCALRRILWRAAMEATGYGEERQDTSQWRFRDHGDGRGPIPVWSDSGAVVFDWPGLDWARYNNRIATARPFGARDRGIAVPHAVACNAQATLEGYTRCEQCEAQYKACDCFGAGDYAANGAPNATA